MSNWACLICFCVVSSTFVLVSSTDPAVTQQCPNNNHCNRFCHSPEGICLSSGRCLCNVGFTGPNATESSNNPGQVEAEHCLRTCHPVAAGVACNTPCDPRCKGPKGECQSNGKCLCWWGWTGPNAYYVRQGPLRDRILADFCDPACNYGAHYNNGWCAQVDRVIAEYL